MKQTNHRISGRAWTVFAVLTALVAVWLLLYPQGQQTKGTSSSADAVPLMKGKSIGVITNEDNQAFRVSKTAALTNLIPRLPKAIVDRPDVLDRETINLCLKAWVRKRDGHEIEVVSTQAIHDLNGNPKSMNVLVTVGVGSGLTSEKLREQLDVVIAREGILREQLQRARQAEDIAGVNRLVAEMTESRTAFITTNNVISYKVSLTKEHPPVLAFWPGLPFETVREEAARILATTKLGDAIGLQGLVHYTSATALLCFTNTAGSSVYIDPFRVVEIKLKDLQAPRPERSARLNDDGKASRIAAQWTDFLNP